VTFFRHSVYVEFVSAPEMLDPKVRTRVDDCGAAYDWMSVPPVKEVAIQPAATDVLLQSSKPARVEKNPDAVLTTRLAGVAQWLESRSLTCELSLIYA